MKYRLKWRLAGVMLRVAARLTLGFAVGGVLLHLAVLLLAIQLSRAEQDHPDGWVAVCLHPAHLRLRKLEQSSPVAQKRLEIIPPSLVRKFRSDLDEQLVCEDVTLLSVAYTAVPIVGLFYLIVCGSLSMHRDRQEARRFLARAKSRQASVRPEESFHPKFPELVLFIVGNYDEAADFAEALRDRYEEDWLQEWGKVRADRWYCYEVAMRLPSLHKAREKVLRARVRVRA